MARNVEIKARIESVEVMWPRVVAIADSGPTEIFWEQELEVVLREGESTEAGAAEASVLMERLGIPQESLIDGAYVDLLSEKRTTC